MKLKRDELAAVMELFSAAIKGKEARVLLEKLSENDQGFLHSGLTLHSAWKYEADRLESCRQAMREATRVKDKQIPKTRRALREARKDMRRVCHGDPVRLRRMGLDKSLGPNRSDEVLLEQARSLDRRLEANKDLHQYITPRKTLRLTPATRRSLTNTLETFEILLDQCRQTREQYHRQVGLARQAESELNLWVKRASSLFRAMLRRHFPGNETALLALFGFHIPISKTRDTVRRYRERKRLIEQLSVRSSIMEQEPSAFGEARPQAPRDPEPEPVMAPVEPQASPESTEGTRGFIHSLNRQTKPYSLMRGPSRRRWGAGL